MSDQEGWAFECRLTFCCASVFKKKKILCKELKEKNYPFLEENFLFFILVTYRQFFFNPL